MLNLIFFVAPFDPKKTAENTSIPSDTSFIIPPFMVNMYIYIYINVSRIGQGLTPPGTFGGDI
jgi:hypothetical protein